MADDISIEKLNLSDIHDLASNLKDAATRIESDAYDMLYSQETPTPEFLLELSRAFAQLDQPATEGRQLAHKAAQTARKIGAKDEAAPINQSSKRPQGIRTVDILGNL